MLAWLNCRWSVRVQWWKLVCISRITGIALSISLSPTYADVSPPKAVKAEAGVPDSSRTKRQHTTVQFNGQVVWLGDAIEQTLGIKIIAEARQSVLVLLTDKGIIHPLLEDRHGRAFRLDKRLRDQRVKLLVRRHKDSPFVQVIRVFAIKKDGLYELDYWCEICAIAMFDLRACDCCQGPIEWRERKTDPATLPKK